MILGQSRTPFTRPAAASPNFTPGLPGTNFYSHFDPFSKVMNRQQSFSQYMPGVPRGAGPHALPAVPIPQPVVPAGAAAKATTTSPGGTAGFGAAGFGSTGGVRPHMHVSPYMTMHSGIMAPGVLPNASNIRSGVRNTQARIQRNYPFQNRPLAPLPAPAPVALPASPAPGSVAGFFGLGAAAPRRARRRRWWQIFPPSTAEQVVAEQEQCETYAPTIEGIKRTVCNGRVVKYEDAQGNVRYPGQIPAGLGAVPQHAWEAMHPDAPAMPVMAPAPRAWSPPRHRPRHPPMPRMPWFRHGWR